jgi:hypothetical protein
LLTPVAADVPPAEDNAEITAVALDGRILVVVTEQTPDGARRSRLYALPALKARNLAGELYIAAHEVDP